MRAGVWHYDGVTALRRRVELVAEGDGFTLWVEADITGTVDVGDHDRLVIR